MRDSPTAGVESRRRSRLDQQGAAGSQGSSSEWPIVTTLRESAQMVHSSSQQLVSEVCNHGPALRSHSTRSPMAAEHYR
jgi:hypothetical protein